MRKLALLFLALCACVALLSQPVQGDESPAIFEPTDEWKEIQPHEQIPGVSIFQLKLEFDWKSVLLWMT